MPTWCNGRENESRKDTVKSDPVQIDKIEDVVKDSVRLAIETRSKSVWKRSLIVPGWGQASNGGLWWLKVPVIYGGFLTAVLVYDFNQKYYKEYLAEAQYRIGNNDAPPPWSRYQWGGKIFTNSVINAKNYHRRNRDLTVLLVIGWWGVNAVEAYVSDMLKNRWSINDELSAKIVPTVFSSPVQNGYSPMIGLKLQIGFDAWL